VRTHWIAGAVADASGNDVMAQLTLCGVVGQRQTGVVEYAHDGLPVIDEFARDLAQRLVRGVSLVLAQLFELLDFFSVRDGRRCRRPCHPVLRGLIQLGSGLKDSRDQ